MCTRLSALTTAILETKHDTEHDTDDDEDKNCPLASRLAAIQNDIDILQTQKQIHFFLLAFLADSTARFVWFNLLISTAWRRQ